MGMRLAGAMLLWIGLLPTLAAAQPATPVGIWRTFDDRTGRERGAVAIEQQGSVLTGRIIDTADPADASRVCGNCKDARKDRPIVGLVILTGMRPDGDEWTGGEILDPETGSVYRCTLRLEAGGTKLNVRGYVGLSLFGRSQTWIRRAGG